MMKAFAKIVITANIVKIMKRNIQKRKGGT